MAGLGTKVPQLKGGQKVNNNVPSPVNSTSVSLPSSSSSHKSIKAGPLFQRKQLPIDNSNSQGSGTRKGTRRHSLDAGSSSMLSKTSGNATLEPKSILKHNNNNKPRRSSVAFGDLPHSAEYEQIMSALLATNISQDSSSDNDDVTSSTGKVPKSGSTLEEEVISEEDDDDESEHYAFQMSTMNNIKDGVLVKRVTFNDEIFCAPDLL